MTGSSGKSDESVRRVVVELTDEEFWICGTRHWYRWSALIEPKALEHLRTKAWEKLRVACAHSLDEAEELATLESLWNERGGDFDRDFPHPESTWLRPDPQDESQT